MSANETYELAVQLRGEGIDETESEIEGVEQQFDDTADSVGESADQMEAFSERWSGAMTAIMGGLAIAAAALLTQVPVVDGLMSSLSEVISAVAFQMDQVLRPVLQPLTDAFFGLADAIFEAEGPVGTFIGVLGSLIAIAGLAVGALALLGAVVPAAQTGAGILGLSSAAGSASSALAGLAGAVSLTTAAIVGLIAVIALLVAAFIVDFKGIRSGTIAALQGVVDALAGFVTSASSFFADLVGSAYGWGVDLMTEFADGIVDGLTAPLDALNNFMDDVVGAIGFDIRANDRMAQRFGEDMMTHFGIGVEKGQRQAIPTVTGDQRGDGDNRPATGSDRISVQLDGRRVDKGTRRHSDRETAPRGRHS